MSLFSLIFGNKPKTAHLAKERLQLIIAHERDGGGSCANFLPDLQRELIAVISKYVRWKSRATTKCWKSISYCPKRAKRLYRYPERGLASGHSAYSGRSDARPPQTQRHCSPA